MSEHKGKKDPKRSPQFSLASILKNARGTMKMKYVKNLTVKLENVFFSKYGFWNYSERCKRYHENEICEKYDCEIRKYHLRLP